VIHMKDGRISSDLESEHDSRANDASPGLQAPVLKELIAATPHEKPAAPHATPHEKPVAPLAAAGGAA